MEDIFQQGDSCACEFEINKVIPFEKTLECKKIFENSKTRKDGELVYNFGVGFDTLFGPVIFLQKIIRITI